MTTKKTPSKKILNTPLQRRIIAEWNKTYIAHPSLGSIAKSIPCSIATVHKTIQAYKATKQKN